MGLYSHNQGYLLQYISFPSFNGLTKQKFIYCSYACLPCDRNFDSFHVIAQSLLRNLPEYSAFYQLRSKVREGRILWCIKLLGQSIHFLGITVHWLEPDLVPPAQSKGLHNFPVCPGRPSGFEGCLHQDQTPDSPSPITVYRISFLPSRNTLLL